MIPPRTLNVILIGILYFGIVTLVTTASVVLDFAAPDWFLQRLLNALTLPLSCLFTARFLLHLRAWEHKRTVIATEYQGSDVEFESFQASTTAFGDFGEDPVREVRREEE